MSCLVRTGTNMENLSDGSCRTQLKCPGPESNTATLVCETTICAGPANSKIWAVYRNVMFLGYVLPSHDLVDE
jgi:hypothetical protein